MSLKITASIAKVLQALRAAPMDSTQLAERFVASHTGVLTDAGLIRFESGYYKLTAKGREACPNRRNDMPPAPVVPVLKTKRIDTPIKQPLPIRNENNMKHKEQKDNPMGEHVPTFGEAIKAPLGDNTFEQDQNVHAADDAAVAQIREFAMAYDKKTPLVAAPKAPKIRFCLTSDHTIIIETDGYPTLELDQDQTEALVTFVEDVAMSIPAYTKHFVGGASL